MADTREAWLIDLANELAAEFEWELPPFRVSVGFPSGGVRSNSIGECWNPSTSPDGVASLFVHPRIVVPRVVDVLAHELVHAVVGTDAGHGKRFKVEAVRIGLGGKMTATEATDAFTQTVAPILERLGPYPHTELIATAGGTSAPKKQTTRMLKAECENDGYLVRLSQKWAEEGHPICGICECRLLVTYPEGSEDE